MCLRFCLLSGREDEGRMWQCHCLFWMRLALIFSSFSFFI
jgi:hypothetical protein